MRTTFLRGEIVFNHGGTIAAAPRRTVIGRAGMSANHHTRPRHFARASRGGCFTARSRATGDRWQSVGRAETDADGRLRDLVPDGVRCSRGRYRLTFGTSAYFEAPRHPHVLSGRHRGVRSDGGIALPCAAVAQPVRLLDLPGLIARSVSPESRAAQVSPRVELPGDRRLQATVPTSWLLRARTASRSALSRANPASASRCTPSMAARISSVRISPRSWGRWRWRRSTSTRRTRETLRERARAAAGRRPRFAATIRERVVAKLQREPVEDFRIDFEDGYGNRPDRGGRRPRRVSRRASGRRRRRGDAAAVHRHSHQAAVDGAARAQSSDARHLRHDAGAGDRRRLPANFVVTVPS